MSSTLRLTYSFLVRGVGRKGEDLGPLRAVTVDVPLPSVRIEGGTLTPAQRAFVADACLQPMLEAFVAISVSVRLVQGDTPASPDTPDVPDAPDTPMCAPAPWKQP